MSLFLSTLSLRRATWQRGSRLTYVEISIHALLAESDRRSQKQRHPQMYFYPRSPCGERPFWCFVVLKGQVFLSTLSLRRATSARSLFSIHKFQFLSTLSLRRATICAGKSIASNFHFYPRSPCGERPPPYNLMIHDAKISIHALLAESDQRCY